MTPERAALTVELAARLAGMPGADATVERRVVAFGGAEVVTLTVRARVETDGRRRVDVGDGDTIVRGGQDA